jgi:hypothetical protein
MGRLLRRMRGSCVIHGEWFSAFRYLPVISFPPFFPVLVLSCSLVLPTIFRSSLPFPISILSCSLVPFSFSRSFLFPSRPLLHFPFSFSLLGPYAFFVPLFPSPRSRSLVPLFNSLVLFLARSFFLRFFPFPFFRYSFPMPSLYLLVPIPSLYSLLPLIVFTKQLEIQSRTNRRLRSNNPMELPAVDACVETRACARYG